MMYLLFLYVLTGDSAGGNLAAAVSYALAYQRSNAAKIKFQVLIYPMLQAFDFRLPSFTLNDGILASIGRTYNFAVCYLLYWRGNEGAKYLDSILANNHTTAALKQSKYASYVSTSLLTEEIQNTLPAGFSNSKHNSESSLSKEFEKTMLNPLFSPLLADDLSKMPPSFLLVGGYDVLRDDGLLFAERLSKAGVPTRKVMKEDGFHGMWSFTRLKIGRDALADVAYYLKSNK